MFLYNRDMHRCLFFRMALGLPSPPEPHRNLVYHSWLASHPRQRVESSHAPSPRKTATNPPAKPPRRGESSAKAAPDLRLEGPDGFRLQLSTQQDLNDQDGFAAVRRQPVQGSGRDRGGRAEDSRARPE